MARHPPAAHVLAGAPVAYAGFAGADLAFAAAHVAGLRWAGFDSFGRPRRGPHRRQE